MQDLGTRRSFVQMGKTLYYLKRWVLPRASGFPIGGQGVYDFKGQVLSSRKTDSIISPMWYCMPVIPKLRHLRQGDYEVKASLGYIARLSLTHTRRSNIKQL